jgi:hypothetical protein
VIRAALKILLALALIEMAFAPRVSAASTMNSPAVQLFSCSVSSDPSPADFFVPAGAIPLGLAMADFTGDSQPDLATLKLERLDSSRAYYVIEIRLTEGGRQSLKLTAPARSLVITPMDVTGDGTLDLVVHSVGSKVPVAVFLNDGCGHFSANESARFATAIREFPSGPDFSASHLRFESATLTRGRYAAGSQEQTHCFLHDCSSSHFFAYDRAPAELLLPLRTDRAPPAAA